jgi:SNF2 family DNA or RNA helicase
VWCHLNDEGDLLEKIIPNAVQVSGSDSDSKKEELLRGFSEGKVKVLITKPKIAGFGLNWQQCSHMTFFPSHSFEQYYQCVRRCWRFGQTKPVTVDIVTTGGGESVLENLKRKSKAADVMFTELVKYMSDAMIIDQKQYTKKVEAPSWL